MDFLWHKVSEKEKESIRKQAKEIMDNFSSELEKIENLAEGGNVKRENYSRKEGKGKNTDKKFRKIFFENAPHDKDFVKSEKGKWL
ncbi:hypothetical protein HZA33_02785 [Candidatus Pacearchaeota archaeon]|nr:hypothetical protein [Candidatus Pacearchaeota archaeon]